MAFSDKSVITKITVSHLRKPLFTPFRTALGEHRLLENILFAVTLKDNTKGYGEAAIATHITHETVEKTFRNLNSVQRWLIGKSANDYQRISRRLNESLPKNKSAVAAVETALLDAMTRRKKIPLWNLFGAKPRRLTTDITIVISGLKETEKSAKKFYKQGFRAFKVKIGRDFDLDIKRVIAVRKIVGRSAIYLDANQGYNAQKTLRFLASLKRAGVVVQLIEQPVAKKDWGGLKEVTRLSGIPVCADESVTSFSDAKRLIREKAAHAINIKLMKFGFFEAQRIIFLAKANNIKLMIGGMMESSLAMTAAAHMASGMGGFSYVDLDTPFFIKGNQNPYLSSRGVYDLKDVDAGIGLRP